MFQVLDLKMALEADPTVEREWTYSPPAHFVFQVGENKNPDFFIKDKATDEVHLIVQQRRTEIKVTPTPKSEFSKNDTVNIMKQVALAIADKIQEDIPPSTEQH